MEEETEQWFCPECMDKYEIEENHEHECKLGLCPMCLEYRNLVKAEPLKESGEAPELEKQEGIECLPITNKTI